MFGEIRSFVGPFLGPGIKHRNIFTLKSGAYSPNVVGSRPTNKNNDLHYNPPAEIVRTEICTEIFKGLGFKSSLPMA